MSKDNYLHVTIDEYGNGYLLSSDSTIAATITEWNVTSDAQLPGFITLESTVVFIPGVVDFADIRGLNLNIWDRESQNLVLELFHQACYVDGKYDHMCTSPYEEAQARLIQWNLIKPEDCRRK